MRSIFPTDFVPVGVAPVKRRALLRRRSRASLAGLVVGTVVASLLIGTASQAKPTDGGQHLAAQVERTGSGGAPAKGRAWPTKTATNADLPAPTWPKPGRATVTLAAAGQRSAGAGTPVRAGDLPVTIGRSTGGSGAGVSAVSVELLDRSQAPAAWRDGLLLRVAGAPGDPAKGTASVAVDYRKFTSAYGGSWSSRLRLWQLPECALTSPDRPGCAAVPLPSRNQGGTVTADVPVPPSGVVGTATTRAQRLGDAPLTASAGTLLALAAGPAGGEGDFKATPLSPSATWSSGGSTGNFTWSYPMRVPPTLSGPRPTLELSYSSAAVDGKSQASNNQPSWIGEGFDYWPGYIERSYVSCSDDTKNGATNSKDTGDECWRSDNATLSLNGKGSELVFQTGKGWHARSEDGSKIEKLTGESNGDNDGEYWKVTDADGTQYFFGRNNLPGQSAKTNSAWTVPVAGNHSGEPCFKSGNFGGSFCDQAWRWNLDYVVDVHGNTMSYWYDQEVNYYGRNFKPTDKAKYIRGGTLARIDYGTWDRDASDRSVTPLAQVAFDRVDRCASGCSTHDAAHWKDVPWDQECLSTAADCGNNVAPTFWSTKRLAKITTQVWDTTKSTPAWQPVDSWTFSHSYPAVGDGSDFAGLWLNSIVHTGLVGGSVAMPPVTFEPTSLPNRVLTAHNTSNNRMRIGNIVTEAGAKVQVTYNVPECANGKLPSAPETNTKLCYPVIGPDPYAPDGPDITEWWHKYVVTKVSESDLMVLVDGTDHGQPVKNTFYTYVGTPAWHYADDDGLVKPNRKTWNQFRGYATVETRVGDEPSQTLTRTTFLRGMHGDRLAPTGGIRDVTVAASVGTETVKDEDQFAGMTREQVTYNGVDTKPVSKTVNVPWMSSATASRTINGDTVTARYTNTRVTYQATALGQDGTAGWRTVRTESAFDDAYGTVNWTQDDGDLAKSDDQKCVRYSYNRNPVRNLLQKVKQVTTTALTCDKGPTGTDDVIADERTYYDGATDVDTAPTTGLATRSEKLKDWSATGGTVWQTVSTNTYDAYGRPVTSTDVRGNTVTTAYTPATGGPVTSVAVSTVDPQGGTPWTTTTVTPPYWGATTKTTDANKRVTENEYDSLGRVTKVWAVGWDRASHLTSPSAEFAYTYAPARDAYPYTTIRKLTAGGGYRTAYQITDALMRPRQTQTTGANGERVVTDTLYDPVGREATAYTVHAEPGSPSGGLWWKPEWSVPSLTKTVYDDASRPTNQILFGTDGVTNLVEKWRSVTTYRGDQTDVTPPKGGTPVTTVTDAQGRTVELRQHASPDITTRYTFDRKGQLKTVTDTQGNEWSYGYDIKGRKVSTDDPDSGHSTSGYDDYDQLTSTTDANNKKLVYEYDKIGRKIGLYDNSIAAATKRASWKYDQVYGGATVRGQLTESTRYEPAGSANAYTYRISAFNTRYQPTGAKYLIPATEATGLAGTWSYIFNYSDFDGSPTETVFPAAGGLSAELVTTKYAAASGLPTSLKTDLVGSYVSQQLYTAYGEPTLTQRKIDGGVYVEDSTSYDLVTRRVDRVQVKPETSPGTVVNRGYSYDPSGNYLGITDAPQVGATDNQCFRYDTLSRLSTAWTPATGVDCKTTDPSVAGLTGPAPYWQDWTFDSLGNRRTETNHTGDGDTTRTFAYPTAGKGVVRPHAVTSVTTASGGQPGPTLNFGYDSSGNTVCRPTGAAANTCPPGESSQTLAWDPEGHLTSVSGNSASSGSNIYDAEGARLIRRDSTGTTLYLPGQEIRSENSVVSATRYYSFAGNLVGSRTPAGLTWLFTDHQGTQDTMVDAARQTVTVRRQTPYGVPRGPKQLWGNPKGFVGGDNDPSGLTHLGAREYDPNLGQFISVDPVQDLADPQQWNGYAYSHGSPVTNSDPSGLIDADCNEFDCYGYSPTTGCPGGCGSTSNVSWGKSRGKGSTRNSHRSNNPRILGNVILVPDGVDLEKFAQMWRQQSAKQMRMAQGWGDTAPNEEMHQEFALAMDICAKVGGGACDEWIKKTLFPGYWATMMPLPDIDKMGVGPVYFGALAPGSLPRTPINSKLAGEIESKIAKRAANIAGAACSFSGDTGVLMADGSRKAIKDVKVGDQVLATDPETGRQTSQRVTHLWIHEDTLVALSAGGKRLVTTEDHPFWSKTDQRWERADALNPGDLLLASDGTGLRVDGLLPVTSHFGTAYTLTVEGIHTYHVLAGNTSVLVHNCGEGVPAGVGNLRDGAHMATSDAMETAAEFVGPGYRDMGGGRFLSKDGLRQVRLTDADLAHPRQNPHINFETYDSPIGPGIRSRGPVSNIHIYLPEEPGWHLP
ncbi:polymorphic toxin-type HINT domain-containing protein [Micromonospora zhanjiangensis]|uniref:Polymorphic toxin-type HINT domain-containing protein n=1 Tax=Micromonospora zhanjiangensis TaxID=1522057 RepID=A0ABV8KLX8_9ACTN